MVSIKLLHHICALASMTVLFSPVSSNDSLPRSPSQLPLRTHIIHQFPNPTWIENVGLRHNTGELILTLVSEPSLYLLDPNPASTSPILVHSFSSTEGLLGITELPPGSDVFYLATSNFSGTNANPITHTSSIYRVDLRSYHPYSNSLLPSSHVRRIAYVSEASYLNGLTTVPNSDAVLMVDSGFGVIYTLSTTTGKYKVYLNTTETQPSPSSGIPLGVNGLKIRNEWLYFTNTGLETFNRVKIGQGGLPEGAVQVLAASVVADDFCFDKRGRAWLAQHALNTVAVVEQIDGAWKVTVVAGNVGSLEVAGGTACVFGQGSGKGSGDEGSTLYLVTTGGLLTPVNGTAVEGGKVVGIETKGYHQ